MFDEQVARKPDQYPWTKDFIDAMWNGHWTPNEFSFSSDIQDFKTKIPDTEREILVRALSAIGQIEIAVKKFWARLGDNLPHPSINDMGLVMANIEVIHNVAYEKLLEVLGLQSVFEENLKLDFIAGRVKYLKKYLSRQYEDDKKQYVYAIALFTLFVENVSLFSQFYVALWVSREHNAFKDMSNQIAYTANEELIHSLVGMKVINTLREEYPELFDDELEHKIMSEAKEAFKSESKIVDWMLGDFDHETLNKHLLKEFIKNRINESMVGIGFNKVFDKMDNDAIKKTAWFDERVLGNNMKDFFHSRPTEYIKGKEVNENDLF